VTFFVAADTHLGVEGIRERNLRQIRAMNALPGKPWPGASEGALDPPRSVVLAGDLTDHGTKGELAAFEELYGTEASSGSLRWQVSSFCGNHDRYVPAWYLGLKPVHAMVRRRYGGLRYSWDWDDVHLVALGEYPDADTCDWLAKDLARTGSQRPVILFLHYSILGPYSDWWSPGEKEAFARVIQPFNVAAIFHGHYHNSGHYRWAGHQVYNVGSPRHSMHSFCAVHVNDRRLSVASYNWGRGAWQWSHSQALLHASS
jgi:predicted phosphodiesterase